MSNHDLESIKKEIIKICLNCFKIKDQMMENNVGDFKCYVGGGRQYHPHSPEKYIRTIYLSRDSKRYENIPEDVIDLSEVYHIYRRDNQLEHWDEHPYHPLFKEAIESLREESYFLMISIQDIMDGNYSAKTISTQLDKDSEDATEFHPRRILRFIKLNPEKNLMPEA